MLINIIREWLKRVFFQIHEVTLFITTYFAALNGLEPSTFSQTTSCTSNCATRLFNKMKNQWWELVVLISKIIRSNSLSYYHFYLTINIRTFYFLSKFFLSLIFVLPSGFDPPSFGWKPNELAIIRREHKFKGALRLFIFSPSDRHYLLQFASKYIITKFNWSMYS